MSFTIKIALFQRNDSPDWRSVFELPSWCESEEQKEKYCPSDYHQISPWMDVIFPELPKDERILGAVKGIDREIAKLARDHLEKLNKLNNLKATFLALGAPAPTFVQVDGGESPIEL